MTVSAYSILDDINNLQQQREEAQQVDGAHQLLVKIHITKKSAFCAHVNGGCKLNPVGKLRRRAGLVSQWVRKLISV